MIQNQRMESTTSIQKVDGEDAVIVLTTTITPDGKKRFNQPVVVTREMIEKSNANNAAMLALLGDAPAPEPTEV